MCSFSSLRIPAAVPTPANRLNLHPSSRLLYLEKPVDHLCHRCGATVTEGALFCSQCGAPQIRVAVQPAQAATVPLPPGTPDEIQPPAQPVVTVAPPAGDIDWRRARQKLLLVGIICGLLTVFLPANGIGFLAWMLLGGFVAVRLYAATPGARLNPGAGAKLGAVTGLAGFATWTALFLAGVATHAPELRDNVRKSMQEWVSQYPSPQASQVVDWVSTPAGFAALITISIVMALVFFLLCCAISGALAGALARRNPS